MRPALRILLFATAVVLMACGAHKPPLRTQLRDAIQADWKLVTQSGGEVLVPEVHFVSDFEASHGRALLSLYEEILKERVRVRPKDRLEREELLVALAGIVRYDPGALSNELAKLVDNPNFPGDATRFILREARARGQSDLVDLTGRALVRLQEGATTHDRVALVRELDAAKTPEALVWLRRALETERDGVVRDAIESALFFAERPGMCRLISSRPEPGTKFNRCSYSCPMRPGPVLRYSAGVCRAELSVAEASSGQ